MYFFVALGGALGSSLRYFLSRQVKSQGDFPWSTFAINLLGAFLLALLSFYGEKRGLDQRLVAFLKVGFCGGFTTFSTLAFELFSLESKGQLGLCILYALASILLSILLIYLARYLVFQSS